MHLTCSRRSIAPSVLPLAALFLAAPLGAQPGAVVTLNPATMAKVATVDERFQSYNIEMIQVMGGNWWAPYDAAAPAATPPAGGFANAPMKYRAPVDLADPRLRVLAAGFSPAYVRVSDAWANTVYFQDDDKPQAPPPAGFRAAITRKQWQGVVDYSKAVDARIVTSFSIGAGTRDAAGLWTPVEAAKLMAFFGRARVKVAAAEFFNEPNLGVVSGTPRGYDAAAYARDFAVFRGFLRKAAPGVVLLGPGPVGEDKPLPGLPKGIASEDILKATGPGLDGVSWHFYGAVSQRCRAFGPGFQTTPEAALSHAWLSATEPRADFYKGLRDRYEPGKQLWLSETAESACGGNPWSASFLDSFRYLNQLGTLAKRGVNVVMHNTLAGSDYGLIDDVTFAPRPNYWAAVLWRRLMGSTVLDAGAPVAGAAATDPDLYVYAHCLRGVSGGVALLAINADRTGSRTISLPVASRRYVLSAADLSGTAVALNGVTLALEDGKLPAMVGVAAARGSVTLAPATIGFFAMPGAGNAACSVGRRSR